MRVAARTLGLALLAASAVPACVGFGGVTRVVDGREVEGRYVPDQAYAAFLRGSVLESQGDLDGAASAYEQAIAADPDSPELWTRLGAVRCLRKAGPSPWDAFTHAAEIDAEFEATWTERAKCHLRRGDVEGATRSARIAVSLDPESIEAATTLALAHERAGRLREATLWLDGLVARDPRSKEAQQAMLAFATRIGDATRRDDAARALGLAGAATGAPVRSALAAVDTALLHRDLLAARRAATAAHLPPGALASRAAALGQDALASEQASLVLAADPGDADARIAAAVAADLVHDAEALGRALADIPQSPSAPSPLATALMAELLGRRIGGVAAEAWRRAAAAVDPGPDELVAAVLARSARF